MPTFRIPLTMSQDFVSGGPTVITIPLTGVSVGDTLVVLHGTDWANNPSSSNSIFSTLLIGALIRLGQG